MTQISAFKTISNLFSPFAEPHRNRTRARSNAEQAERDHPTPQTPPAARQRLVQGPGAFIRPGGAERLSVQDRAMAHEFGSSAARASRGSTRRPELPAALRPPAPSYPVGPGGVTSPPPIEMAQAATGVPREFLSHLIGHESAGVADARPPLRPDGTRASSAVGHGQFTIPTWLDMMRRYGPRYGAGDLSEKIVKRGGRSRGYTVSDSASREEILALRENPEWAALMTAHYADENASALRGRLGRNVREGEVYLAHFLGPDDAADLIRAGSRETAGRGVSAVSIVDRASVDANQNVFYTRQGVARTAREVVELQTRGFRRVMWPTNGRAER